MQQRAVHLAPAQVAGQQLAQLGFQGAAAFWQTHCSIQEAVIDAADLAHQGAIGAGTLLARKTGHARNHG